MKNILHNLVLFILFSVSHLVAFGQAPLLNRAYFNLSHGYPSHSDFGAYLHTLNYLTVGYNFSYSQVKTGPAYYVSNNWVGAYHHVKNRYLSQQLYVGITTRRLKRFDVSFLCGPEWIDATLLSNFVVTQNNKSASESITYDEHYKRSIGASIRLEALFEITKGFGLNLSVQQHYADKS